MAVLSTLYKTCFQFCVTVANAQVLKTLISPGDGTADPYDGIRSVHCPQHEWLQRHSDVEGEWRLHNNVELSFQWML